MIKGVVCAAGLVWASVLTAQGQSQGKSELLARWHFVGTRQLAAHKELPALSEILALKETQELRAVAARTLAAQAAARLTRSADPTLNAGPAALFQPLLPDLLEHESRFQFLSRGPKATGWALLVRLPGERHDEWSRNLQELAKSARMEVTPGAQAGAWTARREDYSISFAPSKDMLVVEGGSGSPASRAKDLRNLFNRRATREVLTAVIDFPALARLGNGDGPWAHAPKLDLAVVPRQGGLRSEMLIDYPRPLNISPEPWTPPVELIHDPLIGFTAIQGVREKLGQQPRFQQLNAQRTPNQLFFWSRSSTPFSLYLAGDVGDSAAAINAIVSNILPNAQLPGGRVTVATNRPALLWRGLPAVTPYLEAADQGRSPYLVAGLFPISAEKAEPAPKELFAQLNKKKLVYYDWEITEERLKQWRPIWQFAQILQGNIFPASASDRWIEAITPKLANSVTEVTLENSKRLKLTRQSQSGLTALELVLLAHALDPDDIIKQRTGPGPRPQPGRPAPPPR